MTTQVMSHDIFTPRLTSAVNFLLLCPPDHFYLSRTGQHIVTDPTWPGTAAAEGGARELQPQAELENFSRKQLDAAQEEGRKRAKADKMASIRAQEASTRRIEDLQMQLTGVHKKLEEALMDKAAANRAALAAEDNAYGLQQQWDSCKEVGCFT